MSGLPAVGDRLFGEPCLSEMLGKKFGLRFGDVGKVAFEHAGDPRMQLLAASAQQACIGSVADERMLELVCGGGRGAAREDEAGLTEPAERRSEVAFPAVGDRR